MKNCTLYPVYVALAEHDDPMGFGDTPEEAIHAYQHIEENDPDGYTLEESQRDHRTDMYTAILPDYDKGYIGDDPIQYIRDCWETVLFADPIN